MSTNGIELEQPDLSAVKWIGRRLISASSSGPVSDDSAA